MKSCFYSLPAGSEWNSTLLVDVASKEKANDTKETILKLIRRGKPPWP